MVFNHKISCACNLKFLLNFAREWSAKIFSNSHIMTWVVTLTTFVRAITSAISNLANCIVERLCMVNE